MTRSRVRSGTMLISVPRAATPGLETRLRSCRYGSVFGGLRRRHNTTRPNGGRDGGVVFPARMIPRRRIEPLKSKHTCPAVTGKASSF